MLTRRMFGACAICAAAGLVATAAGAETAQTGPLKRTLLHRAEVPGTNYVVLQMAVEIAPGTLVPRHTHPGIESAYIIEGGGQFSMQGEPDRPVRAADSMEVPAGVPHALRNGDAATKLFVTYTVEKDKPLATPAPA